MNLSVTFRKLATPLFASLAALTVFAGISAAQAPPAPAPTAAAPAAAAKMSTLTVRIKGIRNATGKIGVVLYADDKGFPLDPSLSAAAKQVDIDPKTLTATAVFENLPQGTYAATVLHDEKMIGKMEFASDGTPMEGYGISNNPDSSSGPPTFDESKFMVDQPETAIDIAMVYW
jgi:uncharacterized protein (DUF2141 family)